MTSPAKRVPREKKRSSRRPAGTATTSAPRNAAPISSSASSTVATGGPSGSHISTATPARSPITSGIAGLLPPERLSEHRVEHRVEQVQGVGGGGRAAQYHDLHPVPFL